MAIEPKDGGTYVLEPANKGVQRGIVEDPSLAKGVNILEGRVVHPW